MDDLLPIHIDAEVLCMLCGVYWDQDIEGSLKSWLKAHEHEEEE